MQKGNSFFWLRAFSAYMDIAFVYSLGVILRPVIWAFTFIGFDIIFSTLFIVYYTVSYLFSDGQTPAKSLLLLSVQGVRGDPISFTRIILREFFMKGALGIIVPLYLLPKLFMVWLPALTAFVIVVLLFISSMLLLLLKRPWWEMLSKTRTVKKQFSKANAGIAFLSLAVIYAAAIFISLYPFLTRQRNFKNTYYPAYPATAETTAYADFIREHAQSPSDYIFNLFKQYDIVVLSERMHPECTQYDFITRLVSDARFVNDIGNVFTECGSVSFQDTLNTYLHTSYPSEDNLDKSTAILQRNSNAIWPLWSNTNLFNFFKQVNKLNSRLTDSAKINWYFTDLPVDWRTMNHEKQVKAYSNPLRDSIMARHIIEQYTKTIAKQRRHKTLVIMNTRHGYGFHPKLKQYNGTTAFLMRAFPGKVANVMLNTVSIRYGNMFVPVQQGKWETAFLQAGNPDAAFNFANSPFGDDKFDAAFLCSPAVTYEDMFTGFVFYKPLEEHFSSDGFPYRFDQFEDTIIKRAGYVSKSFATQFKKQVEQSRLHPGEPVHREPVGYAVLYNLAVVIVLPSLILLSLVIAAIFFILGTRRRLC